MFLCVKLDEKENIWEFPSEMRFAWFKFLRRH